MVVLYGNNAFSILAPSTKKQQLNFMKKVFTFQKICLKVKVFEKIQNFHWLSCKNLPISQMKGHHFQKDLWSFCWKAFSSRKPFSSVKTKTNPNFCRKTCWKEQPFIFTVYLIKHIFLRYVLLIRVMACIELNWLYKNIKKVGSSQAVILVLNWVKHGFSLWVSSTSRWTTVSFVKQFSSDITRIILDIVWCPMLIFRSVQ